MNKSYKFFSDVSVKDMSELFSFIGKKAVEEKIVMQATDFEKALHTREKLGSTGLENGIAIPHGIDPNVLNHFIFVISLKNPIEWQTFDNSKVDTIICFAVPKKLEGDHLKVLQAVSVMLLDVKNQELLKTGNLIEKEKLFSKVFEDVKADENKQPAIVDSKPNVDKSDLNLIDRKRFLLEKISKNNDQKLKDELKKTELAIIKYKKLIEKDRINLKKDKAKLKIEFGKQNSKINSKIETLKTETNSNLTKFSQDSKKRKEAFFAKIGDSKSKKNRELIQNFKFKLYQEKNEISRPLEQMKKEKAQQQIEYNKNKKEVFDTYVEKIKATQAKIFNKKNYLYKHANFIQNFLLLSLIVIGIWTIIVGTLGTSIASDFVFSNVSQWGDFGIVGFEQTKLDEWLAFAVTDNLNLSIIAIVIGALAIATAIPLKMYKIKSPINEKAGIFFSFIAAIIVGLAVAFLVIEVDNIAQYELLSGQANKLDQAFGDVILLNDPLRNLDFYNGDQNAFDKYEKEMKEVLQRNGINTDLENWLSEVNIDEAFNNAKITASEKFAIEILKSSSEMIFINLNQLIPLKEVINV